MIDRQQSQYCRREHGGRIFPLPQEWPTEGVMFGEHLFDRGPSHHTVIQFEGDATGDVIVGDRDGVVVVPLARLDAVLDGLRDVEAKERTMDAAVRDGLPHPDWLDQALADKGVRIVT